jgi:hypothetical protein
MHYEVVFPRMDALSSNVSREAALASTGRQNGSFIRIRLSTVKTNTFSIVLIEFAKLLRATQREERLVEKKGKNLYKCVSGWIYCIGEWSRFQRHKKWCSVPFFFSHAS